MALSNYTELQASIANWLSRSDLGPVIPDFIALAESDIADDVRIRPTVTTLTTVAGQDYVTLPADWLEFVYIKYQGEPLEYAPPDVIRSQNTWTGDVREYSIEGRRLLLNPTQLDPITLDVSYHARIPALSVMPTNWLLTENPSVYLWRSLVHAGIFVQDDAIATRFDALYKATVQSLTGKDQKSNSSGSPLRIRAR